MATEFKLPELGENIETADVINVLVKVGDHIEKDQPVIEIETDKATIEVPSSVKGEILSLNVKTGDQIKVGQVLFTVDESSPGSTVLEKSKTEKKKSEPEKENKEKETPTVTAEVPPPELKHSGKSQIIDFKLPELGENIEEADIVSVLVKPGDDVAKDQALIEIETDKATIEVPSSHSGKIKEVLVKTGEKAKVGQVIVKIETGEPVTNEISEQKETRKETKPSEEIPPEVSPKDTPLKGERETKPEEFDNQPPILKGAAPAAPSVRRLARELGVDINSVPGSGPAGRISMDDVKNYVKKLNEGRMEGISPGIKKEPLPDFSVYGNVRKEKMSKIRKVTATHLSYAWSSIPHVTQFDKADITELEKIRKELNPEVEEAGGKLTVTSILLKVCTEALKRFPQFNSSIDMENMEIIYKDYYNIGIAVDTEHGLIVPVIRDADKKNLKQLSVELTNLAVKARNRKVSPDELQGGNFSITNLGGIGGTSFTPIVNSPEVAILGVSRSSYEPVLKDGRFVPRLMLPLSLSYDHRIIDGADAAKFLRWVCEALEQPIKILL